MTEAEPRKNRAPEIIWKTLFERAIFSYFVEINNAHYFVNDYYVERLCHVENNIHKRFAKMTLFAVIFSIISVGFSQNAFSDLSYQGIEIARLSYIRQLCVLFLGLLVAANVIFMLDILTVNRMRLVIFSHSHSEVPNMRMLHWKENNAWIDAILPKYVGYSSGIIHVLFTIFSLIWVLAIPIGLLFFYISAQIIVFSP